MQIGRFTGDIKDVIIFPRHRITFTLENQEEAGYEIQYSRKSFKGHFCICKKYSINKVILFGSRARGDNTERSDIDIAVYGGDFDSFYWDIKEKVHSLLSFDVVEADKPISEELKQEIEKDGVIIYEKA